MTERCWDCFFWNRASRDKANESDCLWHVFKGTAVKAERRTSKTDWCAEWQPRPGHRLELDQ